MFKVEEYLLIGNVYNFIIMSMVIIYKIMFISVVEIILFLRHFIIYIYLVILYCL